MPFEQPPRPDENQEKKEKLEQFKEELQAAVESIAGLTEDDFVEQNLEIFGDEEIARQMYQEMEFPLRGFDFWDEDLAEEMLKTLQADVLQDYQLADSFARENGEQVDIFKTRNNDMQVVRIKDQAGHIEWILKPIEAGINK